uniref:ArgG_0 protein n=1 Tax=Fopius arisanus TaxID=64838 RepID=A0A0C9R957_9HYME
MRRSRKGTRLNEAECFDSSLQPLIKKIKKWRLFPQSSEENLPEKIEHETGTRRHSPQRLVRDQPSTEIAKVNYINGRKSSASKCLDQHHQDIFTQMCSPEVNTPDPPPLPDEFSTIISEEISVLESFTSEEMAGIYENSAEMISASFDIEEVEDNEGNFVEKVENSMKSLEDKREERTWWRVIIDFLGMFWWGREDKREPRNRTKKSEGRTLLTGNKENTRIRQIYISSLGRDVKERVRPLKPGDDCQEEEKLKIRQISSPLY